MEICQGLTEVCLCFQHVPLPAHAARLPGMSRSVTQSLRPWAIMFYPSFSAITLWSCTLAPRQLQSLIDNSQHDQRVHELAAEAGSTQPSDFTLSGGCDRKLTQTLTDSSAACVAGICDQCFISRLSEVRFQHPAFLLHTTPQGGNEVMLVRNPLIYQDNGLCTISQGAVLSCTYHMPGNEWPYFLFISWKVKWV